MASWISYSLVESDFSFKMLKYLKKILLLWFLQTRHMRSTGPLLYMNLDNGKDLWQLTNFFVINGFHG